MREKYKKRKTNPIGWGGGKVKEKEVEEIRDREDPPEKGADRTWKEGERF